MPVRHSALCLLACLLWAGNFVAVQIGLDAHMTPFLLTALRFAFACLLLPVVPRPAGMTAGSIAGIGLLIGVGQFGLASLSIAAGLSAGVVSLVLQTQVLFTIALAAGLFGDRITLRVVVGAGLALAGVALLVAGGLHGASSYSPLGLALAVGAAGAAALSNILIKRQATTGQSFRLAVWIAPYPILPLLGLSALTEGSPLQLLAHADLAASVSVVIYGGLVSGVGGTAIWAWLLRRHAASQVALFTPAIPVFAFALSVLIFGQHPTLTQNLAASVVILGLLTASAPLPRRTRWSGNGLVRQGHWLAS